MAIGSALVACVGACSIAVASRRLRRMRRVVPPELETLVRALSARERTEIDRLASQLRQGGGLAPLVDAVLSSASREACVAAVNEHLREVEREIRAGSDVPRAAARIVLASGTLAAVLALASGRKPPWEALSSFVVGLLAALIVLEIDRRGSHWARCARADWDRAGATIARYLGPARSEDPAPPGIRPKGEQPVGSE